MTGHIIAAKTLTVENETERMPAPSIVKKKGLGLSSGAIIPRQRFRNP